MSRKNPRRRRMAAQAALLRRIIAEHGPAHDDSHLLQQGRVGSSMRSIDFLPPSIARSIAYRSSTSPPGFDSSPNVPIPGRVYEGRAKGKEIITRE